MDGELNACAHCGLPAPPRVRFCCFGCELASGIATEAREDHAHLFGTLCFTLVLSMVVMMLALFLYAEDVFGMRGEPEMAWLRSAYRWASLALTLPVLALCGSPLAKGALGSLRAGRLSMEALILLGACAAFGLSAFAVFSGRPGVYFDSAAAALVLATLGRYLEATARSKASRSLGPLVEVSRGTVMLLGEASSRRVSAAEVRPGMRLLIGAHEVCPADLELLDEVAEVDLAVLTGEARPVELKRGQVVPAGAVAAAAALTGVALHSSADSTLERLSELAKSLTGRRTGALRWADRFAAALTPLVWTVALGALVWGARSGSAAEGVIRALAVVLAACPCSYAIASPLVHWLTLRRAFSHHVLIRSPEAIEALAKTAVVGFDKTGTLTLPRPVVVSERLAPGARLDEVRGYVVALEEGSAHPMAQALLAHAAGAATLSVSQRRFVPGRGVTGVDAGGRALSLGAGTGGRLELVRGGEKLADFELREALRPEAAPAVAALQQARVRVVLLSGDAGARVAPVAERLGIEAHASLTPEAKLQFLDGLGQSTAMVGDGVNDAPALAGRWTSFSLGKAAPIAKGVAQVTLLDEDLRRIPWTLELARQSVRRVKGLLIGSTLYNLVFVSLAAAGALRPVWAGLSMWVSSLLALSYAAAVGRPLDSGQEERQSMEERAEVSAC